MKTFSAEATRDGKWWIVKVEGVGTTQGRNTEDAEHMAAGLVQAVRGLDPSEYEVNVTFHLPGDADKQVAEAREAHQAASVAMEGAAAKIRSVIGMVLAQGVTKKDAARLLKVSPQRLSQLSRRRLIKR